MITIIYQSLAGIILNATLLLKIIKMVFGGIWWVGGGTFHWKGTGCCRKVLRPILFRIARDQELKKVDFLKKAGKRSTYSFVVID